MHEIQTDFWNYDATKFTILSAWRAITRDFCFECQPDNVDFWGVRHKGGLKQWQACEELSDIAEVLTTGKPKRWRVRVEYSKAYPGYISFETSHIRLMFCMDSQEFEETPCADVFINHTFKIMK